MKILVPLDGSPLSESALPWVTSLAQREETEILLLRATDPFAYPAHGLPYSMHDLMVVANTKYLASVEERLSGLKVSSHNVLGLPREEICKVAEEQACDLIVMASHGRSGLRRWWMGSVAESVLRHAPCPVLLIRQASQSCQFNHILVPLDGSKNSLEVPRRIAPFVSAGGKVTLLTASGVAMHDYVEVIDPQAWQLYLDSLEEKLRRIQIEGVDLRVKVLDGEAHDAILTWAEEAGCDLIAMSTHGRSGLKRIWMGSVTEKVARRAHCPMLVFPPPRPSPA